MAPMLISGIHVNAIWKDVEAGNAQGLEITPAEVEGWKVLSKARFAHGVACIFDAASKGDQAPTLTKSLNPSRGRAHGRTPSLTSMAWSSGTAWRTIL